MKKIFVLLVVGLLMSSLAVALTEGDYNSCKNKLDTDSFDTSTQESLELSCKVQASFVCNLSQRDAEKFCERYLTDATTEAAELFINVLAPQGLFSALPATDEERCAAFAERASQHRIEEYTRTHPEAMCRVDSRVNEHVNRAGGVVRVCEWRVQCNDRTIDSHTYGYRG